MTPAEALEQVRARVGAWESEGLGYVPGIEHTNYPQAWADVLAILDAVTPERTAPVTVERAYFQVASVHHLHDGRHCLCGFDSLGRARSATEHILDEYRAVLTPTTPDRAASLAPEHWSESERAAYDCGLMDGRAEVHPERTEQEREAAVERVTRAVRETRLRMALPNFGQPTWTDGDLARAAIAAYEGREVSE